MAQSEDTASRFMALFAGHSGAHGTHGEPTREAGGAKWEIKKTARTLREPVTLALWTQHLAGERPLGVISIREDSTCAWGCIDVDEYVEDLSVLVERTASLKLPLVPCRSKSGGLHLFLFLRDPQPAAAVQAVLRDVAAGLGLAGSEIFPKQTQVLAERGDLGNWMVMPYFGGTYDGRLRAQVGLVPGGGEMTAAQFLERAERARVGAEEFAVLGVAGSPDGAAPERKSRGARGRGAPSPGDFSDGPPCCQHLAVSGVEEHVGRNAALMHMGIYYRRALPGGWRKSLEEANRSYMRPPLDSDEVSGIVKSLERKDYEYTCRVEPMCSHCDSVLCRTRKFGVGVEGDLPVISGLAKLDTTPPIWFVDVGGARLELSTEQLQNYMMFHKACMNALNHTFGLLKQADWLKLVSEAMRNVTLIEASNEVGVAGTFHEFLEDFLTDRQRGDSKEDILDGRPWEDEEAGRHYFRLRDLVRFMASCDLRDETGGRIGRNKIARMVTALGGDSDFFTIKGKGTRVFWVPSDVVERAPPADAPPVEGAPF